MNSVDYIKQFPLRHFRRGTVLLQRGDPRQFLMAIREGYVKVTSISDAGIERLLWVAGRYDLVPLEQLFARSTDTHYFYTALTDGSYYEVDYTNFLQTAQSDPTFMQEIARGMSEHYDDFLQRIDAIDGLTVRERLIRTLHYIAQRFSAGESVDLRAEGLGVTHQDIAAMIGSTRETTSLELAALRREGLVTYDRRCFIIHADKLQAALE